MSKPLVIGSDNEPFGAGERFTLPEQGERARDAEVARIQRELREAQKRLRAIQAQLKAVLP